LEEGCRWQRSSFGILEPQGDAIALDSIDLLLLPAVAVDTRGYRLGFGGGYYDRLLERAPMLRFRSCALCFLEQRCAALPNEHHDARLAACLDANGLHLFEQAANVSSAASFPSTTLGAELPQAQSQEPEVP
jgi:5-formyltetrahydrofolate cyclo-ligase